jgi:hypothetical protein
VTAFKSLPFDDQNTIISVLIAALERFCEHEEAGRAACLATILSALRAARYYEPRDTAHIEELALFAIRFLRGAKVSASRLDAVVT